MNLWYCLETCHSPVSWMVNCWSKRGVTQETPIVMMNTILGRSWGRGYGANLIQNGRPQKTMDLASFSKNECNMAYLRYLVQENPPMTSRYANLIAKGSTLQKKIGGVSLSTHHIPQHIRCFPPSSSSSEVPCCWHLTLSRKRGWDEASAPSFRMTTWYDFFFGHVHMTCSNKEE